MVCKTDLAVEKLIKDKINQDYPGHAILAEESGNNNIDSDYMWIIDPIDGSRNYIHGHPTFGISIALAHKREVVMGVVYFPMIDWMFTAEKGKGAERNGQKIQVSNRKPETSDTMATYGCAFHREKEEQIEIFSRYIDLMRKVRIEGAATFAFCAVACGIYESSIGMFAKPWDYAASCLIVEEAGGRVTDYSGKRWNLEMEKFVASNGIMHEELLNKVVKNG
ncbi:MAG: inositol monophosphatase family protein [Candidatus Woesearchaeota archaeon]|nr:inositol monophosphatase family protein [Candidatus Woesearchaeota archaeon]